MLPANFTSLSLLLARISSALYDSSSDGQGSQLERACERFGTCEEQSMQVHVNVRLCACTQLHRKRGLCARVCVHTFGVCVCARKCIHTYSNCCACTQKEVCVRVFACALAYAFIHIR